MAGGQATNSGIDYQQRIAAWCLINQYTQFDIATYFDQIDEELIIEKTYFETGRAIDDINLLCENKKIVFLQVKRSITLSTRATSEFYKTIKQFVEEFIKEEKTKNYFGLITTSDASSKISNDLKKIVLSVRLNEDAFNENPLNESEKDTLQKFETVFNQIYEDVKKEKPATDTFKLFSKRVFIGIIDAESGHTVEIASFMLLKSIGFKNPHAIWAVLIKNSLIYSSGRLSIDGQRISEIFNKYLDNEESKKSDATLDLLQTEVISQGELSVGKEVLLIESFFDKLDYMIVELYRFSDDCKFKSTFYNNKVRIASGEEWKVIQRFATMAGLDRYIEENQGQYKEKRVAIIPANEIDTVEESACAKLHKDHLEFLIKKNKDPELCLHCGKQISDLNAVLVEVEDKETIAAVGNVHKDCLRPIDRILGIVRIPGKEIESYLKSFDFKLWITLLMKGQGMLNSLKAKPELLQGRNPVISWNSKEEYDTDYSYCIKFNLEDGSTSYAYERSKIERVNKLQAEEYLELFKQTQKQHYEMNDPMSVLSVSKVTAPYSELLKIKKTDEVILEIKSAEVAKYSKLIAKVFDVDLFYYAPLCLVRNKDTETIVNLGNVVPIVSDPLEFKDLMDNWAQLGMQLDGVELKIIKSDKDFDNYMRMIFGDNMVPIIDPYFDKNFKLVKGYPINEFHRMIERLEQEKKKRGESRE